jgi:rhodanese-related sulfurtransferase
MLKMKNLLILTLALFGFACTSATDDASQTNGEIIAKDIKSEEMAKAIKDGDVIILDVRTPVEIEKGKIPGALEIDFIGGSFEKELAKLDKSKPVYIYCAAGGRSKKAQNIMKNKGFNETYNLLGGYGDWSSKGLPSE